MDDQMRLQARADFAQLNEACTWRLVLVRCIGVSNLTPLSATSPKWRDTIIVGAMMSEVLTLRDLRLLWGNQLRTPNQ